MEFIEHSVQRTSLLDRALAESGALYAVIEQMSVQDAYSVEGAGPPEEAIGNGLEIAESLQLLAEIQAMQGRVSTAKGYVRQALDKYT